MYSLDFQRLAVRLLKSVGSYRKVAAMLKVSSSTLHRWQRLGVHRSVAKPRPRRKLTPEVCREISSFVAERRVVTIQEIQHHLATQHHRRLCRASVSQAVTKLCGLSRKRTQKCWGRPPNPETVATFREALRPVLGTSQSSSCVVSLDECYFSERVLPLYGYSPKGQRCPVTSPVPSWRQRSLLLAIASDGTLAYQVIQGPCNKAALRHGADVEAGIRHSIATLSASDITAMFRHLETLL